MLILTFDYEKSDRSVSKRVLVPFTTPSPLYGGVDISELDVESQALYINEVSQAKAAYSKELAAINAKFDLNSRYRQFKPDGMHNVKTEDI